MMKRIVLSLVMLALCTPVWAGIADDGTIEDGEYDYGIVSLNNQSLLVTGGGASFIEARGFSFLEVRGTSPLSSYGGITTLLLDDTSELLYSGGETHVLSIYDDATTTISGGTMNMIRSFQVVGSSPHITIICQSGWEWTYTSGKITGIEGVWKNGTAFDIDFLDQTSSGYDPVWENVDVIPEPATFVLLGLGGLLLKRKR